MGDTVFKMIITEHLYLKGLSKHEITIRKQIIESNDYMHSVSKNQGILGYGYNEKHFVMDNASPNEAPPSSGHELYLEAIIGAIYLEAGLERCREWILRFFRSSIDFIDMDL